MNTHKRQLPALTGIRFLLALWVVVYHQSGSLTEPIGGPSVLEGPAASLVLTGYSAVSAFFVLSGFVLAYNYDLSQLRRPASLSRFAVARFARIYPAYATGLLLFVPFAFYRMIAGIDGGPSAGSGAFLLNVFLLQAWVPDAALTWNFPGWSLSDETFFYAVLPFVGAWIVSAAQGRSVRAATRLMVLAMLLWGLSLVMPIYAVVMRIPHFGDVPGTDIDLAGAGPWVNLIRYDPLVRLPEFCIGVVLALLYRLLPPDSRLRNRGATFYLPALALIAAILASADRIPQPLLHNGMLAPAYAVLMFGLALEGGLLVRFLSTPLLVFLGNISYSMYILHAPVYAWLGLAFRRVLHTPPLGMVWLVCYVSAVTGLSAIFYRFAEEPLHRWLRARLSVRVAPVSRNAPPAPG